MRPIRSILDASFCYVPSVATLATPFAPNSTATTSGVSGTIVMIVSTFRVFDKWAYRKGVKLSFIRPGKPNENAHIESFNGKFRDECLNEHWFINLAHARNIIEAWRIEYNRQRRHSSISYEAPLPFEAMKSPGKVSTVRG